MILSWSVICSVTLASTAQSQPDAHIDKPTVSDEWSSPAPGIRYLRRRTGIQDLHMMWLDLRSSHLSITTTLSEDRMITVEEFARRYGVNIAVNANFFHWNAKSCGLAMADGVVWSEAYGSGCDMSLVFGFANQATEIDNEGTFRGESLSAQGFRWARYAVTGKPWIIRQGLAYFSLRAPRHWLGRHPRTAVGISRDHHTLMLVVADGRRPDAIGLNGADLVSIFEFMGAYDAVNLDGGGSTTLYWKHTQIHPQGHVHNQPSDGHQRPVSSHLGIRIR